jgi:hypothetical protein
MAGTIGVANIPRLMTTSEGAAMFTSLAGMAERAHAALIRRARCAGEIASPEVVVQAAEIDEEFPVGHRLVCPWLSQLDKPAELIIVLAFIISTMSK